MPLAVLATSVVLGLLTAVTAVLSSRDGSTADVPTSASAGLPGAREPTGLRVLRSWDARRSRAYAEGDVAALADLYLPGSRTGAADGAVLSGYRDRGLRVTRMRTQLLAARVLHESGHRITVLVTDVLLGAVALDASGHTWPLPRDRPSTRRVVLVRQVGTWRVEGAYEVG
jgi:hypothetical protein